MRRVLLIDDDREEVESLSLILNQEGHSIQVTSDSEGSIHRIKAWKPQLILLKLCVPSVSTAELVSDFILKIRAASPDDYLAIILLAPPNGNMDPSQGLDLGADDFISLPVHGPEFVTRTRTMLRLKDTQDLLKRANHRIDELSSTDDLTGLMNMRSFNRKAQEELLKSRRLNKPVSVLLINLDRFSEINHRWGFQAGNSVLLETSQRIRKALRSIDFVARVGADEFFVLLAETDLANAEFTAERIRDSIQAQPYKEHKDAATLTASIGIAGVSSAEDSLSDLFHFTSEALRSAKNGGQNRIEIYSFA
jgi:two-component system cell cycle response regulator